MKLSYRGTSYEYSQPTLETTEHEIIGKYRGATWRCRTLKELPIPQLDVTLQYRGVAYHPSQNASSSIHAMQPFTRKAVRAAQVPNTLPVYKEISRIHCANLQRNLERRLQVARERGDQALVNLLEAESQQLLCSR